MNNSRNKSRLAKYNRRQFNVISTILVLLTVLFLVMGTFISVRLLLKANFRESPEIKTQISEELFLEFIETHKEYLYLLGLPSEIIAIGINNADHSKAVLEEIANIKAILKLDEKDIENNDISENMSFDNTLTRILTCLYPYQATAKVLCVQLTNLKDKIDHLGIDIHAVVQRIIESYSKDGVDV